MESIDAARAFACLGHPGRLAVFRLLMRFAPRGVRPTEIAAALGLKANTLSHHLAELTAAGLARVERRGRSLYYAADLAAAGGLVAYLALDLGRARPGLLPQEPVPAAGPRNVLFLCTGNSARSLMAEALLRDLGRGEFTAFSAGTCPALRPHPQALAELARQGHDTATLRPKPLAEILAPGAARMDFVFTLCDAAAAEECAPWPGQPIAAHWGLPDPALAPDPGPAFARLYASLRRRIAAFAALPLASLDRLALQARADALGAETPE